MAKFPENFEGYALIIWGIPGHPELPIQDGKLIEDFTSSNVIITSTPLEYGSADDEKYFVRTDGSLVPAPDNEVFQAAGNCGNPGKQMFYTAFSVNTGPAGTTKDAVVFGETNKKIQDLYNELMK